MEQNVIITDEVIENIGILAKINPENEMEAMKKDMEEILGFVNKLAELDTENVKPMSHIYDVFNVLREDKVVCEDKHNEMLSNAPETENGYFKVPKSI
ncbi:MAG: Asp-tRNA(Asn)/Glu-tRNA(Gln) amidotransferase subunit GatC [Lachnospiraceae bacterium]|nr:Asp-tRNA(Asn)/Glu-tRNA(Gln) amidotransferase subunit GatC [Lachnospiraceae bacterium]